MKDIKHYTCLTRRSDYMSVHTTQNEDIMKYPILKACMVTLSPQFLYRNIQPRLCCNQTVSINWQYYSPSSLRVSETSQRKCLSIYSIILTSCLNSNYLRLFLVFSSEHHLCWLRSGRKSKCWIFRWYETKTCWDWNALARATVQIIV